MNIFIVALDFHQTSEFSEIDPGKLLNRIYWNISQLVENMRDLSKAKNASKLQLILQKPIFDSCTLNLECLIVYATMSQKVACLTNHRHCTIL